MNRVMVMGRRKRRSSGGSGWRSGEWLSPFRGVRRPAEDHDPSPQVLKALALLRDGTSRAGVATATGLPLAFVSLLAEDLDKAQWRPDPEIASLRATPPNRRGQRHAVLAIYISLGALNLAMAVIASIEQNATLAALAFGVAVLLILDARRRAKRFRRNS